MSTLDQNKNTVIDYCNQAINQRQPARAVATYIHPNVRQHNPHAADGPDAIVDFMTTLTTNNPDVHLDLRRVIAEDDLVVTHSHIRLSPDDPGTAVIDIYRLADGKITEHWDVAQPVPETTANNNTMF